MIIDWFRAIFYYSFVFPLSISLRANEVYFDISIKLFSKTEHNFSSAERNRWIFPFRIFFFISHALLSFYTTLGNGLYAIDFPLTKFRTRAKLFCGTHTIQFNQKLSVAPVPLDLLIYQCVCVCVFIWNGEEFFVRACHACVSVRVCFVICVVFYEKGKTSMKRLWRWFGSVVNYDVFRRWVQWITAFFFFLMRCSPLWCSM